LTWAKVGPALRVMAGAVFIFGPPQSKNRPEGPVKLRRKTSAASCSISLGASVAKHPAQDAATAMPPRGERLATAVKKQPGLRSFENGKQQAKHVG
jgi:hypothetical protein